LKQYNIEALIEEPLFKGIVLIGTIHLDLEARSTLFMLLERLAPACIAVEISRFSVDFRQKKQKHWNIKLNTLLKTIPPKDRGHYRIELLKRQINMPFEWTISKRAAWSLGIPSVPLDSSKISRKELPLWDKELLTADNLLFLINEPNKDIKEYFNFHYEKAKALFLNNCDMKCLFEQLVLDKNWCKREKTLSKRLLMLLEQYKTVVYIGGWIHTIEQEKFITLAKLVKPRVKARYLITGKEITLFHN